MIRGGTLHRCVAWLALAALTLIVAMPAVSRVIPVSAGAAGMDAGCAMRAGDHSHPDIPGAPDDRTDRCGYCTLLEHTPAVGMGKLFSQLPTLRPAAPLDAAISRGAPITRLLSAPPRGPPSRANA